MWFILEQSWQSAPSQSRRQSLGDVPDLSFGSSRVPASATIALQTNGPIVWVLNESLWNSMLRSPPRRARLCCVAGHSHLQTSMLQTSGRETRHETRREARRDTRHGSRLAFLDSSSDKDVQTLRLLFKKDSGDETFTVANIGAVLATC